MLAWRSTRFATSRPVPATFRACCRSETRPPAVARAEATEGGRGPGEQISSADGYELSPRLIQPFRSGQTNRPSLPLAATAHFTLLHSSRVI